MSNPNSDATFYRPSQILRQQTLRQFRWLAIFGQLIAIIAAQFYFHLGLNYVALYCLVGLWASANLVQTTIFTNQNRLQRSASMIFLLIDLLELSLLLYFSGGLTNPFAVLLIVPPVLASTVLEARHAIFVVLLSLLAILLLYFFAYPITQNGQAVLMPEILHFAMLAAISIATVFLAFFARRVTAENLNMTRALAATELALQREHRLSSLGSLVAAYAHELGSPLATIRMSSKELLNEDINALIREDITMIHDEAKRCSQILANMGNIGKEDQMMKRLPFATIVQEAAAPHQERGVPIMINIIGDDGDHWSPYVMHSPQLLHGLRNVIQNAVDFANERVDLDISFDNQHLTLRILDDGPGYSPSVLANLGEPFLKSERSARRKGYKGMGLGMFISKNLLEGTGAEIAFANRPVGTGTGAIVNIRWPLADIEIHEDETRLALGNNPELNP